MAQSTLYVCTHVQSTLPTICIGNLCHKYGRTAYWLNGYLHTIEFLTSSPRMPGGPLSPFGPWDPTEPGGPAGPVKPIPPLSPYSECVCNRIWCIVFYVHVSVHNMHMCICVNVCVHQE